MLFFSRPPPPPTSTLFPYTTLFRSLFVPGGFIYSQDAGVPPSGMSELEAYSIFYDAYRTGDYELALTYGEWIVASRPRAIEGYDGFSLETQLRRMNTVDRKSTRLNS